MPDGINRPRMFGEVGLGTTQLKADVKEAKEQLASLSLAAKNLGEMFNSLGIKNGLGTVAEDLAKQRSKMKTVTEGMAGDFSKAAEKVKQAQAKMVEAISHNYSMGHISPEKAHKQLTDYVKQQQDAMAKIQRSDASSKGWATRKGAQFTPTDTSAFTSEIVKAEALMNKVWKQMQQTQQANFKSEKSLANATAKERAQAANARIAAQEAEAKRISEVEKKAIDESKRNADLDAKDRMQAANTRIKNLEDEGKKTAAEIKRNNDLEASERAKAANARIRAAEAEAKANNAYNRVDSNATASERMQAANARVKAAEAEKAKIIKDAEDARKAKSKAHVDELFHQWKSGWIREEKEYKNHIYKLLSSEKVLAGDKKKLREELWRIEKKITSDETAAKKQVEAQYKSWLKEQESLVKQEGQKAANAAKKALDDKKNDIKSRIDLDKERYRKGEIDFIQYMHKLTRLEQEAQKASFSQKDMNVFAKERMKINSDAAIAQSKIENQSKLQFEREYAAQSKHIVDNLIAMRKQGYVKDVAEHKNMLDRILADETRFTRTDIGRLQSESAAMQKKHNDERIAGVKQYNKEVLKATEGLNSHFGSAEQRFKSLSNYAFDSTLIYGSLQGIKEIATAIKEIELASTNLQRVLPSDMGTNVKTNMTANLRNEAFSVGEHTGQSVKDVQAIQNLWARTSDKIAASEEAMKKLTEITAKGMEVGGFTSAEEAVRLLNSTINQMGLNWTDAEHIMSSWVKVADSTAVGSAKDLADMISRVGEQGKMLGLTYHDLNGMTAVFANNMSRTGTEIGTAMKTVFSYFEEDSTIKILAKYGVEVKKNAKEFNNFNDIMAQLGVSFEKLKLDNNQQAIAEMSNALGRIRRRDYVGVLLEHWNETRDIVKDSLESLNETSSYLEDQAKMMENTYEHKLNAIKVAFQQLAWTIGESGLLDHLKAMAQGISSAIHWFSGLDPAMKHFILLALEMSAALLLVSKSMQVLAGSGLVQILSNATARLAVFIQSQGMLNASVLMGQNVMAVNTVATVVNTEAKVANAAAQEAVNIVDSRGNVISSVQTSTTAANTVATVQNTTATQSNAAAKLTLANAQRAGAGTSGLLGGALAGMMNPLTALIAVTVIGVAAWQSWKKSQAEAKAESDKFAASQQALKDILAQKVVDQSYIPELEKRADLMADTLEKYESAVKGMAEAQKASEAIINNPDIAYDDKSEQLKKSKNAFEEHKKVMESSKKTIGDLGSTVGEASKNIEVLNHLIDTSSDATTRNSYAATTAIEKIHKHNDKVREQIEVYGRLVNSTSRTAEEENKLNKAISLLTTFFPQYVGQVDAVTKKRKVDTAAILGQVGAIGSLSEAQIAEIKTTTQLDEASLTLARNRVASEIAQTKATKENTISRINMMKSEMKALGNLLHASGADQFGGAAIKKSLTKEQIGQLKASGEVPMMIAEDQVFDYLHDNDMLPSVANKEVADLNLQLKELEGTLKVLEGIKPFKADDWDGTPLAGDDDKAKSAAEKGTTYLDFQNDRLDAINSQIGILKTQLDMLDDTDANRLARLEKIGEIRDKENQKLTVLNELTSSNKTALGQVNADMEKYIAGWSKMDGDKKLASLNSLTDKQKGNVSQLTSEYQKLTEGMLKNNEEIAKTKLEIKNLNDEIEKLTLEAVSKAYTSKVDRSVAIAKANMDSLDEDIDKLKNNLDSIDDKDPDAIRRRIELEGTLLDKESSRVRLLNKDHRTYNDLLWEINMRIEKQIAGFNDMSGVEQITAINNLTDEQRQKLQPLLDLWEKLEGLMKSVRAEVVGSTKSNQDTTKSMQAQIEAEYKKGLELQKQLASRRLLAKHEQEQANLELLTFGQTKKQWEYLTSIIQNAKQLEIDKLKEQIGLQEHLNDLKKIDVEIEKVKKDTRFAYIDEATGKEINTYDRAKVAELEKQKQEKVDKKVNDEKVDKLENELKALQDAAEEKRKLFDTQLEDLKKYQQFETDSFNDYWSRRMTDERIRQEALELIRAQGYESALRNTQKFNSDLKAKYDSFNQPMYDTGFSLNKALLDGMSQNLNSFIKAKSDEMYALGIAVAQRFKAGMMAGGMVAGGMVAGGGMMGGGIPTVSGGSTGGSSTGGLYTPIGGGSYAAGGGSGSSGSSGGSSGSSGGSVYAPIGGGSYAAGGGSSSGSSSSNASKAEQMKQNSEAWFGASDSDKAKLAQENKDLAKEIGAKQNSNGDWVYPKYHVGGFVGGEPLNPIQEEFAKLLKGEFVLTDGMMARLTSALTLPNVGLSVPSVTRMETTLPSGKTTSIYINTIQANNFEEMMRSLDPYIDSHK